MWPAVRMSASWGPGPGGFHTRMRLSTLLDRMHSPSHRTQSTYPVCTCELIFFLKSECVCTPHDRCASA